MRKIVFFLKNELIPDIDYTNVCTSNPGVGGTEYLFVLTAYALSKRNVYEIVLYAQKPSIFPEGLKIKYADNVGTGIQKASKENADVFICREDPLWIKYGFFENIPEGIKVILWAHNFIETKRLDYYYKSKGIYSLVCVGREQLDMYIDHRFYDKMDYIYNANAFPSIENIKKHTTIVSQRHNIVTYIGALQPFKGFHVLAKAWKKVLKKVPDAELYVIGSGKVYNNGESLGKYGIASASYENSFMPYLVDDRGNILPSVHFMGRLGQEKNDIIKITKVGVPNPSGMTETFGLGAIEFQGFGCCVVTKKCPGYMDTVLNKENLYENNKQISDFIIRNLKNASYDYYKSYKVLYEKFHYDSVAVEWEKYFDIIFLGGYRIHNLEKNIPNYWWNLKWLRILNRKIRVTIGFSFPTIKRLFETRIYRSLDWHINNLLGNL